MYVFHPNNPNRPPDWRWQLAKYLADNNLRMPRSLGDAHISQAKQFATALNAANEELEHYRLATREGALYAAWSLYQATNIKSSRWELEARLLAGEDYQTIANKSGYSVEMIMLYERIFFAVQDRLEHPSYIANVVLGESFKKGLSDREPDLLWKLFAYAAGPDMLDFLVYRFNKPSKPTGRKAIEAFLVDDVRSQMQLKANIALRTMPINWQTQIEIMNLFYRMIELEKDAEAGGEESFKQVMTQFLEEVPWTKKKSLTYVNVIDQTDASAVSLRAQELLAAGVGDVPQGLEHLVQGAVFPDIERVVDREVKEKARQQEQEDSMAATK